MKVPKSVRVGGKKIVVHTHTALRVRGVDCRGAYRENTREIHIARRSAVDLDYRFTNKQRGETFWHELTHAILHDMGKHKLNCDERFVTEFAERLDEAVRTAKFD